MVTWETVGTSWAPHLHLRLQTPPVRVQCPLYAPTAHHPTGTSGMFAVCALTSECVHVRVHVHVCVRVQNMSLESVEAAVVAASPGMNNATQAEFVKFHDDKVGMRVLWLACTSSVHAVLDICHAPNLNAILHSVTILGPWLLCSFSNAMPTTCAQSTYTGVYAKGGPTNVDKVKASGLAGLLDRSPADVRGVKKF